MSPAKRRQPGQNDQRHTASRPSDGAAGKAKTARVKSGPDQRGRGQRRRPDRPSDGGEILYGKHSVRAVFQARPKAIRRVLMREGAAKYLQEFIDLTRKAGLEPELLPTGEFLRIGGLSTDDKHQGIFVIADPLPIYDEYDFDLLLNARVVLVLDQISNPQNFGTMIRTAAFFGADGIVWLKDRAAGVDPTVSRVSVGGTEMIKLFRVTNLARALQLLKDRGFWTYGFDERGEHTLAQTRFDAKTAVIIGAEGEGMRQRTKLECDELVRIPGGRPGLGSLNAAIATGIVLAEIFRDIE